jgi:hypothetical protein
VQVGFQGIYFLLQPVDNPSTCGGLLPDVVKFAAPLYGLPTQTGSTIHMCSFESHYSGPMTCLGKQKCDATVSPTGVCCCLIGVTVSCSVVKEHHHPSMHLRRLCFIRTNGHVQFSSTVVGIPPSSTLCCRIGRPNALYPVR